MYLFYCLGVESRLKREIRVRSHGSWFEPILYPLICIITVHLVLYVHLTDLWTKQDGHNGEGCWTRIKKALWSPRESTLSVTLVQYRVCWLMDDGSITSTDDELYGGECLVTALVGRVLGPDVPLTAPHLLHPAHVTGEHGVQPPLEVLHSVRSQLVRHLRRLLQRVVPAQSLHHVTVQHLELLLSALHLLQHGPVHRQVLGLQQ